MTAKDWFLSACVAITLASLLGCGTSEAEGPTSDAAPSAVADEADSDDATAESEVVLAAATTADDESQHRADRERELARQYKSCLLDAMIRDLEMRQTFAGPGVTYGSSSHRRTYWVSPFYPDDCIEVVDRSHERGRMVFQIKLHDRQR